VRYGFGVLGALARYALHRRGLWRSRILEPKVPSDQLGGAPRAKGHLGRVSLG
jgi:hypothetical protein